MGVRFTGFTRFGTLSDGLHTPSSAQRQHAILESGGNTPGQVKQGITPYFLDIYICDIVSQLTPRLSVFDPPFIEGKTFHDSDQP